MARTTVGDVRRGARENGHWGVAHLAAEKFKNRSVVTSEGHSGQVMGLGVGEDGRHYADVDFGDELGRHEVPLEKLAFENNRFLMPEVADSDVRLMPRGSEGHLRGIDPGTMLDVRGYQRGDDASIHVQHAAAQVNVERPALAIHWKQPAPEVTVHQPTPQVNVRQTRPVITVRQPPPVITVELEQPEIIVSMAEPEVDVSIAEAHVEVSIPKPNVQVLQPEKPVLDFVAEAPVVSLEPRASADVSVERSEPEVRYERMGEPKVIIRHAEGEPRVRYEELSRREAMGVASNDSMAESLPGMVASRLESRDVFDSMGDKIGSIGRLLVDPRGNQFFVLERGGLLGRKRLLAIEELAMSGDKVITPDLTDAELRKMPDWDERSGVFAPMASDSAVLITRRV